jgi:hypothetical protein
LANPGVIDRHFGVVGQSELGCLPVRSRTFKGRVSHEGPAVLQAILRYRSRISSNEISREMAMKQTKVVRPSTRSTGSVRWGLLRGILAGLTLMSILVADPAMARRGKGGTPAGIKQAPASHSAAQPVPAQDSKPVRPPRRHGSKSRGGAN